MALSINFADPTIARALKLHNSNKSKQAQMILNTSNISLDDVLEAQREQQARQESGAQVVTPVEAKADDVPNNEGVEPTQFTQSDYDIIQEANFRLPDTKFQDPGSVAPSDPSSRPLDQSAASPQSATGDFQATVFNEDARPSFADQGVADDLGGVAPFRLSTAATDSTGRQLTEDEQLQNYANTTAVQERSQLLHEGVDKVGNKVAKPGLNLQRAWQNDEDLVNSMTGAIERMNRLFVDPTSPTGYSLSKEDAAKVKSPSKWGDITGFVGLSNAVTKGVANVVVDPSAESGQSQGSGDLAKEISNHYLGEDAEPNLVEIGNAAALGMTQLLLSSPSEADFDNAGELTGSFEKDGETIEVTKDDVTAALYGQGFSVGQAIGILDGSIKHVLGERANTKNSQLAPALMMNSLVNTGVFQVRRHPQTGELRLVASSHATANYEMVQTVNTLVFKAPRGQAQTTMPDAGLGAVAQYAGHFDKARDRLDIQRAADAADIPVQIQSLALSLMAVQNFPHEVALGLAVAVDAAQKAIPEISEVRSQIESRVKNAKQTPLTPEELKAQTLAGVSQLPKYRQVGQAQYDRNYDLQDIGKKFKFQGYTSGEALSHFFGTELPSVDAEAANSGIYTSRSIAQLLKAQEDKQPRHNIFRVDVNSYRLYIPGTEFNTQGNTIIRSIVAGTPMKDGLITKPDGSTVVNLAFQSNISNALSKPDEAILKPKEVQGLEAWAKNPKKVNGDVAWNTLTAQVSLLSLAQNIVPQSRHLTNQKVASLLTPRLVEKWANSWEVVNAYLTSDEAVNNLNPAIFNNLPYQFSKGLDSAGSQAAKAAKMIKSMGRKVWGNDMRAMEAAYNLKAYGSTPSVASWSHQLSGEADMVSAGRMFQAVETGTDAALQAGAYVANDFYKTSQQTGYDFLTPNGTPRTQAMINLLGRLKNSEKPTSNPGNKEDVNKSVSLGIALSEARQATVTSELRDIETALLNGRLTEKEAEVSRWAAMSGLGEAKSFDDMWFKGMLMTHDYGSNPYYKGIIARETLNKIRSEADGGSATYRALLDTINSLHVDEKGQVDQGAIIETINDILVESVATETALFGSTTPKKIAHGLSVLNILPRAKGLFGEDLPIGQMGMKLDLSGFKDMQGRDIVVINSQRDAQGRPIKADPAAPAKTATIGLAITDVHGKLLGFRPAGSKFSSSFTRADDGKKVKLDKKVHKEVVVKAHTPAEGTAGANAVGPALGQTSETAFFAELDARLSHIAPWLHGRPEMFMAYTFDNIRSDPMTSFLMEQHSKDVMVTVMKHNKLADFVDLNFSNLLRATDALRDLGSDTVELGVGGQYQTVTSYIDKKETDWHNATLRAQNKPTEFNIENANKKAKKLWQLYRDGMWRPVEGFDLTWTEGKKEVKKTLESRKQQGERRLVTGNRLARFMDQEFINPLKKTNAEYGKAEYLVLREIANGKKKDSIKAIEAGRVNFFAPGRED